MDEPQTDFLTELVEAPGASGFEEAAQRRWIDYVSDFADEVRTDAYGNAVAIAEGDAETTVAMAGHSDKIGVMVREITEEGFLRLSRIGGVDRTVTQGQHVQVHTDDGPVNGVIGQTAIHLRDRDEDAITDVNEQYVDIGADDREEAETLVAVGDPITFESEVRGLQGSRLTGHGMDNRIGMWAAAAGFRQAVENDVEATVYAVSTVQEELGLRGAKMVGFDLDVDAMLVVDVTHATDSPGVPSEQQYGIELGAGPVLKRGGENHPAVVETLRDVAGGVDLDVQIEASSGGGGTDAAAFSLSRGGIPSANVGLPNRYMHTPVEVIDTDDLSQLATLLSAFAAAAVDEAPFEAPF